MEITVKIKINDKEMEFTLEELNELYDKIGGLLNKPSVFPVWVYPNYTIPFVSGLGQTDATPTVIW